MKATYYLIWDCLVGKEEEGNYSIFRDGKWVRDTDSIIRDRHGGYDVSEPDGSPYGIGSGSVMDEMDEITYEKAMELTGGRV